VLRARRFLPLRGLSCVMVSAIGLLCLITSAYAQTSADTPAQSPPPETQSDQPQADADGQPDDTSTDEVATAEDAEADCGCPKVDPEAEQTVSEATSVIAANVSEPDKICGLVTPLVVENPCAAPDVIAAASEYPDIAEKLAQCLSTIQSNLKAETPEAAETVEKVVSCAPPAFQAAYSESLAPDATDTTPGADAAGGADGGPGTPGAGTTGTPTGGNGGFSPTNTFGAFTSFGSGPTDGGSLGGGSVSPF
jgi:hypothetical protein